MARLALLAIVFLVLVSILLYYGFQALVQRARQKEAARYAPELLRYNNVPNPVAVLVIEQGKQLDEIYQLMIKMGEDQAVLIPSEYANPIERWVGIRQQQRRRLS